MTAIEAIFRKEWLDHVRDGRSMSAALAIPLVGPVLLTVVLHLLTLWMGQQRPLLIDIEGGAHAPELIHFLQERGAEVHLRDDVERRVRERMADVALRVRKPQATSAEGAGSWRVEVVTDGGRPQGAGALRRLELLLEQYAERMRTQRLRFRGIAPEIARPLQVDIRDVSTPEQQAGRILNAVPLFLLLAAFLASAQVALDAAAGERERGSLEPLLLNPLRASDVVIGKWLSAVALGLLGTVVTAGVTAGLLSRVPLEELGVRASVGLTSLATALSILAPLVAFTAALQLLLSIWARSYKEAQTYVSLVLLLPTAPGVVLALNPSEPAAWTSLVPALGQQVLLLQWVRGESIPAAQLGLSWLGCVLAAAVTLWGCAVLLRREVVILGR
ncbi:MAG: ABC transporter permease [Myxococcaceae bacterium]